MLTQVEVGLRTHYINMPVEGENNLYFPLIKSSNCGKALKAVSTSKSVNTSYGSRNELRYGNIEIDARKEIGNPQPTTIA